MKKYLLGAVAFFALTTFTSCEQDAPEINFTHTTTIVSDFSGIIKAINDMSLSLSEKLAIIDDAIQAQTLTFSQKMDVLHKAIENGILTYQDMTQKTIDAINAMNASMAEKLATIQTTLAAMNTSLTDKLALIEATMKTGLADIVTSEALIKQAIESLDGNMTSKLAVIETALADMNTSLTTKLGLIEAAMTDGFADVATKEGLIQQAIASLDGNMTSKLAAIETAMKDGNTTLATKLAAIDTAISGGFASAADQEKLTREALISSLNKGFGDTAESLAAINTALGRLSISDGVYAADKNGMTVSPSAWEALKKDPEMYNSFLNTLEVVTPTVTTSQVSSHSCVIDIRLQNFEQIELLSSQTIYNDGGISKPAYKIVRMFSKATYTIDKGNCALGCWEINITDVAGTNAKYNFGGGAGGNVELIFWDGADKFVLEGHVEVIMR